MCLCEDKGSTNDHKKDQNYCQHFTNVIIDALLITNVFVNTSSTISLLNFLLEKKNIFYNFCSKKQHCFTDIKKRISVMKRSSFLAFKKSWNWNLVDLFTKRIRRPISVSVYDWIGFVSFCDVIAASVASRHIVVFVVRVKVIGNGATFHKFFVSPDVKNFLKGKRVKLIEWSKKLKTMLMFSHLKILHALHFWLYVM